MKLQYSDLREIQHSAIRFVKSNFVNGDGTMLMLSMGMGKSAVSLTAISDLLDAQMISRALIVAPLFVAENTWPDEVEDWDHLNHLNYELLTGSPERRANRVARKAPIHIVNRENIPWLVDYWGNDWPYDFMVIDEMSSFKNPTKRTKPTKVAIQKVTDKVISEMGGGVDTVDIDVAVDKAIRGIKRNLTRFGNLCKIRKYIHSGVVGLTGTPAPNGLIDLWSQYYLIDQGVRLGTKFSAFRGRYFQSDYMGYKFTPVEGAFDNIINRVKDITMTARTEDYVDMPPVIHNKVWVNLPDKVMKQYRDFEKTMLLEDHDIEAINSGVLTGKLLQLANGSIYDEEREVIQIHDLKLGALEAIIEGANGKPVFVAYSFQFDLAKLKKRFPKAEVIGEGKDVVKRWNAGKIQLLLAHPASAGHGLNLQYGGSIAVWYGLTWSLEYYQQFNKRLARPGQKDTVIIHHILSRGTKDEDVMSVLPTKDATQEAIFDATRYIDPEIEV